MHVVPEAPFCETEPLAYWPIRFQTAVFLTVLLPFSRPGPAPEIAQLYAAFHRAVLDGAGVGYDNVLALSVDLNRKVNRIALNGAFNRTLAESTLICAGQFLPVLLERERRGPRTLVSLDLECPIPANVRAT